MSSIYGQMMDEEGAQPSTAVPAAPTSDVPAPAPQRSTYAAMMDDEDQLAKQRIKGVLSAASSVNPDQAAQAKQLSRSTGLPMSTIESNQGEVARMERVRQIDISSMMRDSPVLAMQLTDPDFAKIAHDDTQNLGAMETAMGFLKKGVDALHSAIPNTAAGLYGIAAAGSENLIQPITGLLAGSVLPEDVGARMSETFRDLQKSESAKSKALMPTGSGNIESGVYSGLQSLTQNALMLPLALLPGGQAAALMGMVAPVAGNAYGDSRDKGISPAQALPYAASQGLIEYATEKLPMHYILKDLKEGTPFFKTIAHQMATEIPGEQIATVLQDMNDWAVLNPDQPFSSYLEARPSAAAQTLVATIVATGGQTTVAKGLQVASDKVAGRDRQAEQVEQQAKDMQTLFDLAGQDQVRARDPQTFQQFFQSAADNQRGETANVYVSPKNLAEALDAHGLDMSQMPVAASQMEEAIQRGGDLEIPVGELVTALSGTGAEKTLIPNLRIDPNQPTLQEAKADQGEASAFFQSESNRVLEARAEQADFQQSAEQVKTTILDQLNAAGRFKPEVNQGYASLIRDFFVTVADKSGKSPMEMYQQFPLTIAGTDTSTTGKLDQSSVPFDLKTIPKERLQSMLEQLQQMPGEMTMEDFRERSGPIIKELAQREHDRLTKTPSTSIKEVFPGYRKIANGTKIKATYGIDKTESIGTVVGSRSTIYDGETTMHPVVDFGDGKKRTIFPSEIKEVYSPRSLNQNQRASFDPSNLSMELLANADYSSFLHESGHFFLTVYADLAAQEGAPQGVVDDMNALLKWFGVADLATWNGMSLDQQRDSHEKFAESFERYLFSGKAPSVELQPLFRRVASWMKSVYKTVRDFALMHPNHDLNPEVKAVFDRMLATDQQIQMIEEVRNYTALFKTAEEGGMSESEWLAYQDTNAEATEAAEETLGVRALKDMKWLRNYRSKVIKAIQKDASALRAEVKKSVAAEIEARPEYRAIKWLKRGEMTSATGEEIKVTAGHKLNIDDVKAMYPEGALGDQPDWKKLGYGAGGMLSNEGLSPDIVAGMFGMGSGDQLIDTLLNTPPIGEAIEAQTDQKMLEEHGDLTSVDAIEKAADDAVHNRMRAKAIATELHYLKKSLGSVRILMQAANQYAKEIIGRKKITDVKPTAFTAAETRAAKAAEKALAAGNREQAVAEKRTQILNHAAAAEAMEVKREIDRTMRFFRRVAQSNKDIAKSRDYDMVQAAKAILAEFGIGTRGQQANEYLKHVESNDPAMYQVLRARVDGAIANAVDYNDLTVDNMRALKDEIDSLWFLARRSRQMEIDGDLMDRQDVQDDLHKRMEEIGIPDTIPGEGHAVTPAEHRLAQFQSFRASARRMESWVGVKDGNAKMGSFRKFIWNPVKEAADRYRTDKGRYLKQYRDLLQMIAPGLAAVKINAPELGYVFGYDKGGMGKVELLHAILHTGNESNLRKLLLGRNWGSLLPNGQLDTSKWDSFIKRMMSEGKLTKTDFDFAQGVWDMLDKMKPLAQKTHRDVFGRYFEEVTANSFTNQFGTYRGGYVPAMADPRISVDAKSRDLANQENENLAYAFPSTSKGFTKSRVEYNRPLLLDLRTLASHIDKVLLFSHLEQPVRDVSKVLTSTQVSTALNRIDPAAYDGLLTPWLNRTARQVVETAIPGSNGLMRFFSAAKNRAGMTAMFANIANAAQQVTGLSLAALKVKPKYLMSATANFVLNPRDTANTVAEISPFMANRMHNEVEHMSGAINDILLNPSVYESSKAWMQKHAYFMQSALDNVIGPIVWMGAYNEAMENAPAGMTDEQLKAYARRLGDSAVRETQGSTLPEDISRLETGNSFVRMFTQFSGYFNMNANLLGTEFAKVAQDVGLKKGAGRGLYIFMFGFLAPAIVGELIMQAFKGGPGDDDKDGGYLDDWIAALFGWAPLRYATGMIPIAGPLINLTANMFNNKAYDDRMSTAPAVSMIESAVKAPFSVYKAVEGNAKPSGAIRDVATLISMALGVPVSALAKPVGYLADVNAGRVNPTSPADAVRGVVTGAASPESKN